jgi:S-formylglutathione hydrolase FrmB
MSVQNVIAACSGLVLAAGAALAQTGPRVETVPFKSAMTGMSLPYSVVLPAEYAGSPSTRYPVLFILHGLSDHHSMWLARTNLAEHAAPYRLILVTVEGNNGWYTDSATVPSEKYESYLLQELIPDVQSRYRTIEEGYARGLAGQSMGGYGSLKIALKHPDEFAFAASMSGALRAARYTEEDGGGWDLVWESIRQAFGPVGSPTREANDLFTIARAARPGQGLPFLYLDCGTEDDLVGQNQAFAALLVEKKIAHEYREVPGVHNWDLWDRQIREVLKLAAQKLPRR